MVGDFSEYNSNQKQLYAVGVYVLSKIPPHLELSVHKKIFYPNNRVAFLIGELK